VAHGPKPVCPAVLISMQTPSFDIRYDYRYNHFLFYIKKNKFIYPQSASCFSILVLAQNREIFKDFDEGLK